MEVLKNASATSSQLEHDDLPWRVLRRKNTARIKKWTDKTRPQNMHIIDTWLVFNERWEKELCAREFRALDLRRVHPVRVQRAGKGERKNMAAQIREFCVHTVRGYKFHGISTGEKQA